MRLAVELSRSNIRHGTGGPFGAAIFERNVLREYAAIGGEIYNARRGGS